MRGNCVGTCSTSLLNGFKSQFFSVSNFFFGEATIGLFFFLWPKSPRLKSKSFIFFVSIVFWFCNHSLALLVQAELVRTNRLELTYFSHTSHTRAVAGPYFCCLFKYYPMFVKRIFYWLRFSAFSSNDTLFSSWKIMVLQRF